MQSSSAVAACAVRGNSIYLYYRPANGPSTQPLFILSPQPPLSSSGSNTGSPTTASGPINPYAPSSLSQTNSYSHDYTIITASKSDDERTIDAVPDIGPTAPSSGGDSALFIQVLNIYNSGPSLDDLGRQASRVSIATTSSFDGRTVTYGLLLALNPSSGFPLLVQMNSQSPTTGNRQNSSFSDSPWTLNTLPRWSLEPYGSATQYWLAASTSPAPEGSSVYQLFATQANSVLLARYDVANQVLPVDTMFKLPTDGYHTMIKLTGITGFDAAIVGDSEIYLVDITGSLSSFQIYTIPPHASPVLTDRSSKRPKKTSKPGSSRMEHGYLINPRSHCLHPSLPALPSGILFMLLSKETPMGCLRYIPQK
ncbi:hypothetical protein K457DRAFT_702953 [Linnemannia elongata AG-77]|uniref:Uncharacterized protein n=1 Tax=Linnemannia elongata AG-77 TaxID=1314771 RepID=A0A197JML2_9FUNG|nr:hypothetical protein K457DRAFT_702953 [Linnemannia elongata AG-77]